MSARDGTPWTAHLLLLATVGLPALTFGAFVYGKHEGRGFLNGGLTGLFALVVMVWAVSHAVLSTCLVAWAGRSVSRVLAIHVGLGVTVALLMGLWVAFH